MSDSLVQNQIDANANKEPLDFDDAELVDDKILEVSGTTVPNENAGQDPDPENPKQQTINLDENEPEGPQF